MDGPASGGANVSSEQTKILTLNENSFVREYIGYAIVNAAVYDSAPVPAGDAASL